VGGALPEGPALVTSAHWIVSRAGGVALTLLVVAVAFLVSVLPGVGTELEYQRDATGVALLARGLSGHLVHVGWAHLGWNLLGFLVLGALCEHGNRRGFLGVVALGAAVIPLALYLAEPEIGRYCGLSGLVAGLFGALATRAIVSHVRAGRRALALVTVAVAAAFVWRLGWIWIRGDLWLLSNTGFQLTPVPLSHAIGLAIGVLVECVETFRGPRSPSSRGSRGRARLARRAESLQLEESPAMRAFRSLRPAGTAALAALLLAILPAAARADCASTASFWRETADACAECAARLRRAEAHGAYRPAPRNHAQPRPPHTYRPYPPRAAHTPVPAAHRYPPRAGARAPGLLPVTAASAQRSHEAVARSVDPVVDPLLRETTEAIGTAAGTAIGVALYPPFKVLEHLLGAPD
jgi:membrane associated rhomboid family serine protease